MKFRCEHKQKIFAQIGRVYKIPVPKGTRKIEVRPNYPALFQFGWQADNLIHLENETITMDAGGADIRRIYCRTDRRGAECLFVFMMEK